MSATIKELRDWLSQFDDAETIAIDEGGLSLVIVPEYAQPIHKDAYFELGGVPLAEDGED